MNEQSVRFRTGLLPAALDGRTLKIIALVSMLIDHTGVALFPQLAWMRYVGRLAFPIYCYLLTEGALHTRDIRKYIFRLLVFAAVSELPFDLALGYSQTLANAPIRLNVTLDDLTRWKNINFFQHFILGVDFFPSNNTWVALGYNLRRSHEMKANGSSHWAGFSVGAGLNIKKIKVGVAWGKYHIAASSLIANLSYAF
jgi:hypothetical protein